MYPDDEQIKNCIRLVCRTVQRQLEDDRVLVYSIHETDRGAFTTHQVLK